MREKRKIPIPDYIAAAIAVNSLLQPLNISVNWHSFLRVESNMEQELDHIRNEVDQWRHKMLEKPSLASTLSKKLQTRINRAIPEKIHTAITNAIKEMTKVFLLGGELTSSPPEKGLSLTMRDIIAFEKIRKFSNTAAAEGAVTGAGGILLGLADFPIWLGIKMKMLCEIASAYGKDVSSLSERIFLLHVFELTFTSQRRRNELIALLENWQAYAETLPTNINDFDWRNFQQDYRDYIDIAKLLQLVPGIGAAVGATVNLRLTRKLGQNAVNAFRMRLLKEARA